MNIVPRFEYPELTRETAENGVRHYNCPDTGSKLPSVTTILDATSNKQAIKEWRERVGEKEADRQSSYGKNLGSLVHKNVEDHIEGLPRPTGNAPLRVLARRMSQRIIDECLPHVDEVWGIEKALYLPGLYAGTADLLGVYRGRPAVMDHKNAKKMRKREDIVDYRDQLCAYIIAHNEKYGTEIETGVVFMVDRELAVQTFVWDAHEVAQGKESFLNRVEAYLSR
jgi:genome maintenance exonuclease 1